MEENRDDREEELLKAAEKKRKARKRRNRIIGIVVLLAVIGAVAYFVMSTRIDVNSIGGVNQPQETLIETQVYENTYTTTIDLSGYLEPADQQNVSFRTTGTITGLYVEEGQEVKKGDLIVTVDDTSQQYTLASIDRQIEEAKISGSAKDLELLELQRKNAENNIRYSQVTANFDGVVATVDISEGDYVEAGTTKDAIIIVDRSTLVATVEIDEIDMQVVRLGMTAGLEFDSLPGVIVPAEITYIPMLGRYSSTGIGVMDVEITIKDPPEGLAPGYSFSGTLQVTDRRVLTLLPQAAVTLTRGVATVQKKLEDGTIQTVPVTVRYLGEGICQLLTGDLKPGDTILQKGYGTSTALSNLGGSEPAGGGQGGPPPGGF